MDKIDACYEDLFGTTTPATPSEQAKEPSFGNNQALSAAAAPSSKAKSKDTTSAGSVRESGVTMEPESLPDNSYVTVSGHKCDADFADWTFVPTEGLSTTSNGK